MNVCGACALDFASVRAFDAHRVGRHAYSCSEGLAMVPPREDGRRCLAVHELRDVGFDVEASGRWFLVEHRAGVSERLRVRGDMAEAA